MVENNKFIFPTNLKRCHFIHTICQNTSEYGGITGGRSIIDIGVADERYMKILVGVKICAGHDTEARIALKYGTGVGGNEHHSLTCCMPQLIFTTK